MDSVNILYDRVIIWGGTGICKQAKPVIEHYGSKVIAIFDDTDIEPPFDDVPLYKGWEGFAKWRQKLYREHDLYNNIGFLVAVGAPHGEARLRIHNQLKHEGLLPITLCHPSSVVFPDVTIGEGCHIMAHAVLGPAAVLGKQVLVHTSANITHDCVLEDCATVAPNGTLCGDVHLKPRAWVCAGATVLPGLTIGSGAVVGAGATVTRDVLAGEVVVGIPAKPLHRKV